MDDSLKDFNKRFTELVKENTKLQHLKERYVEHGKKLVELSDQLELVKQGINILAREIDPVLTPSRGNYSKRLSKDDVTDVLRPILEKMRNGTHVTMKTLEMMYPDLPYHTHYGLMVKLAKMKDVQTAKDGRTLRLFI